MYFPLTHSPTSFVGFSHILNGLACLSPCGRSNAWGLNGLWTHVFFMWFCASSLKKTAFLLIIHPDLESELPHEPSFLYEYDRGTWAIAERIASEGLVHSHYIWILTIIRIKAKLSCSRMRGHMKEIQAVSPLLAKVLLDPACPTASKWQINKQVQLPANDR